MKFKLPKINNRKRFWWCTGSIVLLGILLLSGAVRVTIPYFDRYWSYYSETCRIVRYRDGRVRIFNNEWNEFTTERLNWMAMAHPGDTLTVFSLNGKRGYLNDVTGKIQIEPMYRHAWQFSEGLAAVDDKGMIGFIDTKGQTRIPFRFRSPHPFHSVADLLFKDGHCAMMDTSGKYGLIDRKGNWVVPPKFDYVNNPVNGMRIVRNNRKFGLLDAQLREILPCECDNIEILKRGIKVAKDGGQQLLSKDAKKVLDPFVYDTLQRLQYGTGHYNADGYEKMENTDCLKYSIYCQYGLMSLDGKVLTKAIYGSIVGVTKDLFCCTRETDSKTLNSKGVVVQ